MKNNTVTNAKGRTCFNIRPPLRFMCLHKIIEYTDNALVFNLPAPTKAKQAKIPVLFILHHSLISLLVKNPFSFLFHQDLTFSLSSHRQPSTDN
jgi:hypothetical protein